jgi:3'-phosphoadenosine 5'-phosphosulfate sulfotransferase (PAPS reductase)/FAD synthetase
MQSLPLDAKIKKTQQRIKEWVDVYGEDGVYISFSGGKDSTVLLDIVRKMYPNIVAVFVNTGLEYPSVRQFALSFPNVVELRPSINFKKVLTKYGYPIITKEVSKRVYEYRKNENTSKLENTLAYKELNGLRENRWGEKSNYNKGKYKFLIKAPFKISHLCCIHTKEKPCINYEKMTGRKPIIGTMADESKGRETSWLKSGCNAFDTDRPSSQPMSFWLENDIHTYIHTYGLQIAKQYGEVVRDYDKDGLLQGQTDLFSDNNLFCNYRTTGCKRTGCVYCGFGTTHDRQRFTRLALEEPKLCDYVMRGGAFDTDEMWKPTVDGMGYWFVLEWLNVHGNLQIGIPNREYYLEKYQTDKTKKYLEKE